MKYSYVTKNTCAKVINFDLNDGIVTNVEFLGGGCPGNLKALPRLVNGMSVDEIENKIGNIVCGFRETSCADQLANAVRAAYDKTNNIG